MENAEYYQKIACHIAEIHKRIKRMQSLLLREYDISLPEYHILAVLMKKQQITQNELAEALDVDKALVSRQIRSMQERGFIYCTPDPDCRRKNTLILSEKALQLIPTLEERHRHSLDRVFSDLGEDQAEQLNLILEGLLSKL